MDTTHRTALRKTQAARRSAYSPPKLTVFGPVGSLTQSGSGVDTEAVMNGMVQMNMNRRP